MSRPCFNPAKLFSRWMPLLVRFAILERLRRSMLHHIMQNLKQRRSFNTDRSNNNSMSVSSLEISSPGESTSNGGSTMWQRHRSTILTTAFLFVIFIAMGFSSIVVLLVYMLLRYIWLRLIRDPFLSPTDNFSSSLWEMFTTCPPNSKRTLPTLVFFLVMVFSFLGDVRAKTAGSKSVEPDWLLYISYNAFGSLVVLCCAVWLVDALYLITLFCVGENGEALGWWYRRRLNGYYKTSRGYTPISTLADNDDCDEDGNDNHNSGAQNEDDDMAQEREKAKYLSENRREAKQRLVLILVFYAIWTGLSVYSAYDRKLVKLTIPIPKLPAACDGYKLAMASDLHLGSMSGAKEASFMVQKMNALKPDGIALVGDIGDQPVNDAMKQKLAPLANLRAKDGVFYTFGNHENKHHVEDYRQIFRHESPLKDNIVLLENEHTILTRGGSAGCSIVLLGMADWSGFGTVRKRREGQVEPNLTEALHHTPGPDGASMYVEEAPSGADMAMIMMQHQPKNMTGAADFGVGLQISGHTHGGQLWPQHFVLFIYDAISGLWEYDVGKRYGPSYLFVSEGIVGYGPRVRFLSKTDYALLTLRSPAFFKAEGLKADTRITMATYAMYFAWVVFPISLLACMVPCCCWVKNGCKTNQPSLRRSGGGEDTQLV